MKRKLFIVGMLALVSSGVMLWSCQKDELSHDEVMLKKGKAATVETTNPFTWTGCGGQEIVFSLEGTENSDQIRIWALNPVSEEYEWINVGTRSYTAILQTGTYYFIYRKNNVWYPGNPSTKTEDAIKVDIEPCSDCEESFTYLDNEDGTYTFTYVPAENMDGATLAFTFPQSALDVPLEGWAYNGQSMQKTMNLTACVPLTVTVSLTCKDLHNPQNKWSDFTVNEVSKKGSLGNIKCN